MTESVMGLLVIILPFGIATGIAFIGRRFWSQVPLWAGLLLVAAANLLYYAAVLLILQLPGDSWVQFAFLLTVMIPWGQGFVHDDHAFLLGVTVQAVLMALVGAGLFWLIRNKRIREQDAPLVFSKDRGRPLEKP